jgi:hypothetical protein
MKANVSAKELLDELDAEKILIKRGYKRIKCRHCLGRGWVYGCIGFNPRENPCSRCKGFKFEWIKNAS